MAIPQVYQGTGAALANYTYSEIAEGTGIVSFNGFSASLNGTETYNLTNATPYSNLVSTSSALTSGVLWELDFDSSPLNIPRIMKGNGSVSFTWKVANASSTNSNYTNARLSKWDGTTETEISTASGTIFDSGNGGTIRTSCLKFSDIPITLFKQNEQIRVSVGIMAITSGNSPKGHIAFDPQNRANNDFTTNNFDTTKLVANIPFKIDLA